MGLYVKEYFRTIFKAFKKCIFQDVLFEVQ